MMDSGKVFEKLIHLAVGKNELRVLFVHLLVSYGRIKGDRVAITDDIDIDKINYTLAHEIAHHYLHYDKGDILQNDGSYEEQADRAAKMLLDAILLS